LSFPVIQEFETLMQESIKEVINIHKSNFFLNFMRAWGSMRAGPMRTCGLTALAPPHFFRRPAGRPDEPDPNWHPYF